MAKDSLVADFLEFLRLALFPPSFSFPISSKIFCRDSWWRLWWSNSTSLSAKFCPHSIHSKPHFLARLLLTLSSPHCPLLPLSWPCSLMCSLRCATFLKYMLHSTQVKISWQSSPLASSDCSVSWTFSSSSSLNSNTPSFSFTNLLHSFVLEGFTLVFLPVPGVLCQGFSPEKGLSKALFFLLRWMKVQCAQGPGGGLSGSESPGKVYTSLSGTLFISFFFWSNPFSPSSSFWYPSFDFVSEKSGPAWSDTRPTLSFSTANKWEDYKIQYQILKLHSF